VGARIYPVGRKSSCKSVSPSFVTYNESIVADPPLCSLRNQQYVRNPKQKEKKEEMKSTCRPPRRSDSSKGKGFEVKWRGVGKDELTYIVEEKNQETELT
jgi:hypothetical protein